MKQIEQFRAIMVSANRHYEEMDGTTNGTPTRDIVMTEGSEETWFCFNVETGECVEVIVTSNHYSD